MSTVIQLKRSTTLGSPGASDLAAGEMAYSYKADTKQLFMGQAGTEGVKAVGGEYYTHLFPDDITLSVSGGNTAAATTGVAQDGKILIAASDTGKLDMDGGAVDNVGALVADTATFGDTASNSILTIGRSTAASTITAAATFDLTIGVATASKTISLNGLIGGTAVKNENTMASNSATHIATQSSIKAYVDTELGAQNEIGADNSSIIITDTGSAAGFVQTTLDNIVVDTFNAEGRTYSGDGFTLALKITDSSNVGQDQSQSDINFLHDTNSVLAKIQGGHDGSIDDIKGALILSTNSGSAVSEAIRIDSDQKVTIFGNLVVDGTTTTVNSSTTQIDDPVLTLGGDFGTISAFDSKAGPAANNWTNGQSYSVDATGGSGFDAKFKVVVSGAGAGNHTVTLESGGTKFKDNET